MSTSAPFIPVARPVFGGNEKKYLEACITSGWVSSRGSFIDAFEQRFAEVTGTRYALTSSNGTTALHLALLAVGVGPGDEVIVPAFTFASTATTVLHAGATPVFVDVRQDTWNIDETKIAAKITPRTKAIIPVHIYGVPAAMDEVMILARERQMAVIEDAAEALLSRYNTKMVGAIGDVGCFSFFGNKTTTTGEGGMCITNDKALLDKMALYKNHGMAPERRYWHTVVGYNYRMTNLQAAVGLAQMEQIDEFAAGRRRVAKQYHELLAKVPPVERPVAAHETIDPLYWMYSILLPNEGARNGLAAHLGAAGIETRPVFPPLVNMPIFQKFVGSEIFPVAQDIGARGLSLPTAADLSDTEIERVVSEIKRFFNQF